MILIEQSTIEEFKSSMNRIYGKNITEKEIKRLWDKAKYKSFTTRYGFIEILNTVKHLALSGRNFDEIFVEVENLL